MYQDADIQLIPIINKWEEETTLKIYVQQTGQKQVVTNYELFQQTKLDELKGDEVTETWEEGKQLNFEINKYLFKKNLNYQ